MNVSIIEHLNTFYTYVEVMQLNHLLFMITRLS